MPASDSGSVDLRSQRRSSRTTGGEVLPNAVPLKFKVPGRVVFDKFDLFGILFSSTIVYYKSNYHSLKMMHSAWAGSCIISVAGVGVKFVEIETHLLPTRNARKSRNDVFSFNSN